MAVAGWIVRVLAVALPLALLALPGWPVARRGPAPAARVRAGLTRAARHPSEVPILVIVPAITATHFTDPACPWAYSFRPAHARLRWRFGDQIDWRLVLIGLSETARRTRSAATRPSAWSRRQHRFSDRFGMPFSFERKPRMAGTSRACRAIVAAREIDPALGEAALRALQLLQFTTARVLDDDDDLRAVLATVPGLDADAVVATRSTTRMSSSCYEADRAARARRRARRPMSRIATRRATGRSATRRRR